MAMLLNQDSPDGYRFKGTIREMSKNALPEIEDIFEQASMSQLSTSEPAMYWEPCPSPLLNESQFLQWQTLLEERTGMYINIYHRSLLESNLIIRMREIECSDFDEYYKKVCSRPDGIVEWSILLDRIMVQETRFYRNSESLSLYSNYLSERLQGNTPEKKIQPLNIWSVGCSSGEEPYTLAILCQEALSNVGSNSSFGITATDISLPVLAKAREGIYNTRKLLDLKSVLIDKYFNALDGNKFQIKESLKKNVCFSMANMIDVEKSPLRNLDVIYCQNVLIYFRKERKHIILDSLVERLAPGGLLVIGQGEAFDWHNALVSRVADRQTLAYIRQTTQEH
jgi:chemotaxis protein methyltransferase CheR/type IV pilus assembly protein PilK